MGSPIPSCTAGDCTKVAYWRSAPYCPMHTQRLRRTGTLDPPGRPWHLDRDGYLVRTNQGRREKQHRVVMEEHLGRPLTDRENVHHINGDRADNRIENLELWFKPQPAGQRAADLVDYVLTYHRDAVISALDTSQGATA